MAGEIKFYTIRPMDYAIVTSVTSEAAGFPIENALDQTLTIYWKPTTAADQTIIIDLQNDLQERMTNAADRAFSSVVNWANDTWTAYALAGGVLSLAANASGQYCHLAAAGLTAFVAGKSYRITYDVDINAGSANFRTGTGEVIGTLVHGTAQNMVWTCTVASTTLRVYSTSADADIVLDNMSIVQTNDEDWYAVKGFAFWINNHATEFGAAHSAKLEYSDDAVTYTQIADLDIMDEMTYGIGEPLRVYVWGTAAQKRRYWKLTLHDATEIIQIAGIYLLCEYAPGLYSLYPETDTFDFGNVTRRMEDGRVVVDSGRRTPVQRFKRELRIFSDAKLTTLETLFQSCRGGQTPLIIYEGTDYLLCQMITEELVVRVQDYQYYCVSLEFETLPYVADGDSL